MNARSAVIHLHNIAHRSFFVTTDTRSLTLRVRLQVFCMWLARQLIFLTVCLSLCQSYTRWCFCNFFMIHITSRFITSFLRKRQIESGLTDVSSSDRYKVQRCTRNEQVCLFHTLSPPTVDIRNTLALVCSCTDV